MRYRPFGRGKERVSVLGLGCMRMPVLGDGFSPIDEERATAIVRSAIERGINYLDTAPTYHDGTGEDFVGRALQGGYRDKVHLATKMSRKAVDSREDCRQLISDQLRRLRSDRIDMYLLHNVTKDSWRFFEDVGALDLIERARDRGEISYVGFSSHEERDFFIDLVDAHDWDFCQIQFNYADRGIQAGEEGLRHAASRGLEVVVMEPLKGGILARDDLPFMEAFRSSGKDWSPAEWSLRWVWDWPQVSVVLSGMNEMAQLEENCRVAEESGPLSLGPEELRTLERAKESFDSSLQVPCSSCGYCLPCPQGVNIPRMFTLYNNHLLSGGRSWGVTMYNFATAEAELAGNCVACGECEEKCPQDLLVSELMPRVHRELLLDD